MTTLISKNTTSQADFTQKINTSLLSFTLDCDQLTICLATITVPKKIITILYTQAALNQKDIIQTHGFHQGEIPIEYIKQSFKTNLINYLKEFTFKYCIINFFYEQMEARKITLAGEPRLTNITLEPDTDALFEFEFTRPVPIIINEWKYLPFKSPKRKNYKDIDKQVESFIKEEQIKLDDYTEPVISNSDWVKFTITPVEKNNKPLFIHFDQNFWFKLDDEELESPLQILFLGKKNNDLFFTDNHGLQEYFSDQLAIPFTFKVKILSVIPHQYFCLDQLKHHFKIKTNKDMHKKLIEVFSYRNDISQRLSIVQESLKLLLSKHKFDAPKQLLIRQKKLILSSIKNNPDYNVYRKQKDFPIYIQRLAEKQAKETIFIDQLAYQENIQVSDQDIEAYLNLTKRPRMKEFIYFDFPTFMREEQSIPLFEQTLKRACLREKTINHVIYHLTKK